MNILDVPGGGSLQENIIDCDHIKQLQKVTRNSFHLFINKSCIYKLYIKKKKLFSDPKPNPFEASVNVEVFNV